MATYSGVYQMYEGTTIDSQLIQLNRELIWNLELEVLQYLDSSGIYRLFSPISGIIESTYSNGSIYSLNNSGLEIAVSDSGRTIYESDSHTFIGAFQLSGIYTSLSDVPSYAGPGTIVYISASGKHYGRNSTGWNALY